MLCSFVLLLFVESGTLYQRVEVDLVRVKVRTVNAVSYTHLTLPTISHV